MTALTPEALDAIEAAPSSVKTSEVLDLVRMARERNRLVAALAALKIHLHAAIDSGFNGFTERGEG